MAGSFANLSNHLDALDLSTEAVPVHTYTTDRVLQLVDAGCCVEMNSGSGITVIIPTDAAVDFPLNTVITLVALGPGTVTVTAQGGVTLHSASSAVTIATQYGVAAIYKRAVNDWVLFGNIA